MPTWEKSRSNLVSALHSMYPIIKEHFAKQQRFYSVIGSTLPRECYRHSVNGTKVRGWRQSHQSLQIPTRTATTMFGVSNNAKSCCWIHASLSVIHKCIFNRLMNSCRWLVVVGHAPDDQQLPRFNVNIKVFPDNRLVVKAGFQTDFFPWTCRIVARRKEQRRRNISQWGYHRSWKRRRSWRWTLAEHQHSTIPRGYDNRSTVSIFGVLAPNGYRQRSLTSRGCCSLLRGGKIQLQITVLWMRRSSPANVNVIVGSCRCVHRRWLGRRVWKTASIGEYAIGSTACELGTERK